MIKHDPYINRIIFSEYLIQKKIGKGSFGTVYQGKVVSTDQKIAIKLEKKEKDDSGLLETEACRLYLMQGEGIPKIICYGNNQTHNILIQELLGHSLEELFNLNGRKFTLKTVCSIGIEMIKRIKFVHSKFHIHRDIKPDNFMTGREKEDNKIYIIDFGLAKKYYSVSKAQHIKFCTGKHLIGTARYCGRNAHRGYEQGRRDDIESIGYVLMYFLLGVLPWQGLKVKKGEDQFEKIAQKKYMTSFEELTYGQPEEFLLYFKHCDNLNFEGQPNYLYLIVLFQNVINKYCRDCYYDFDWKKDSCTHYSYEVKENNKSIDVSLIVNKNNDASAIDYSNNVNEDDDQEEGFENKVNKKIKKKDIFLGEDRQPLENNEMKEEDEDEDFTENYKKKRHRSQSVVNIKKLKKTRKNFDEKNINNIKNDSIKKNKRNTQLFDNNFNERNDTNNNENKINNEENYDGINNEASTSGFCNNKIEENEQNNNMEYDNQNSVQISQRNDTVNGSSRYNKKKRKSVIRNDISNNEYSKILSPKEKNRIPRISNITGLTSIDPNIFHFDYKGQLNYNINNENEKNEGNGNNFEEEENSKDKEDNENHNENNWEDMNDMSIEEEEEEGSKRKKRNRSGSVDDKKYRNNNAKCQCFIF